MSQPAPLTPRPARPKIAPPAAKITIVELQTPSGDRWADVVAILLEAGRRVREAPPCRE